MVVVAVVRPNRRPTISRLNPLESPDPTPQVEVRPLGFQHLANASARKKLKSHSVAGALVRMLIQDAAELAELLDPQPTIPLLLNVLFDALGRVVRAPLPLDCEVEYLRQERENAVGLIWPVLEADMNGLNVATPNAVNVLRAKHCVI